MWALLLGGGGGRGEWGRYLGRCDIVYLDSCQQMGGGGRGEEWERYLGRCDRVYLDCCQQMDTDCT